LPFFTGRRRAGSAARLAKRRRIGTIDCQRGASHAAPPLRLTDGYETTTIDEAT
jgi:hypothetical protein